MEINITAPELVNALDTLSAILKKTLETIVIQEERRVGKPEAPALTKEISMDEVKAKLGPVLAAGKQAELKTLLVKFGATKVSEVPENRRKELLEAVAEINY